MDLASAGALLSIDEDRAAFGDDDLEMGHTFPPGRGTRDRDRGDREETMSLTGRSR